MARKEIIQYICDLTGKEIEEGNNVTIRISYDGDDYILDTDHDGAETVENALNPILAKARIDRGKTARGTRAKRDPSETRAIREWAKGEGIALADRGRIPADVEARYHEAMKAPKSEDTEKPAEKPADAPKAPAPKQVKKAPAKPAKKPTGSTPKAESADKQ